MKENVLVFLLLAMILISGCDKDDNGINKLEKLDIINASSLFIASDNILSGTSNTLKKSSGASTNSRLFKITLAGYIEEVKYFSEDGNEITYEYYPTNIYNVCEEYVIVIFGEGATGYLDRKSDGAVFTLEDAGMPWRGFGSYLNWSPVQTDADNNLYYLTDDYLGEDRSIHHLIRIRLDNPARLTAEIISPTEEDLGFYIVNNSGNVVYDGLHVAHPRIIMSGGGLVNAPPAMSEFWLGADGELYGIEYVAHGESRINKLQIVNNELKVENYGDTDFWFATDHSTVMNLQDKVYIVHGGEVFEVFNPTATPQRVEGLGMISFHNAEASGNYYYLSGNNESAQPTLLKVSAQSNVPEILLSPNQYDIYAMTVSHDDNVTFSALRMSDGKKVIGEISASGELSILDEELDSDIIVLERIN